jgi:hypothetical protein
MVNSPFNAYTTTNAAGSFGIDSTGFVQGAIEDNPAARQFLDRGVLGQNETLPMWGGVAISEALPGAPGRPNSILGPTITRATTNTLNGAAGQVTGFAVFDQNASALSSPGSPVPLVYSGGQVNFFRFGCGQKIIVAMAPELVNLEGAVITTQVSWDFNNQALTPYDASTGTYSLTSITSSYSSATGLYTMVVVAAAATPVAAVGDFINISGVTGTGAALVNGNQQITAFTDNEHFSFQVAAASGAIATGALTGTLVLNYGVGALPVRSVKVNIGQSMVVAFSPLSGIATWTRSGPTANTATIIL